jgi:uncharacterized repeat protein (TIGR03803 family)
VQHPPPNHANNSDGNFYGTTPYGGTDELGTVFRISPDGTLTNLYSFPSPGGIYSHSLDPSGLVQGGDGYFYGTTDYGGAGDAGTVFKTSAAGALTTLYSFTNVGFYYDYTSGPKGLVRGSDGNFYGTTVGREDAGTVFKISAAGALTRLYSFTGGNDGAYPYAALVQGSNGNFYGTTLTGGTNGGYGTVFKISADGALTTLHSFSGRPDGAYPHAKLVQGGDGYFYGVTSGVNPYGENYGSGTVFKMSAAGVLTTLYSFTGGNDGANANGLVQGSDGSFYGTAYGGGEGGAGTVFRLAVVPAAPAFQTVALRNGTLSLAWSAEAGGRYQLQYTSELSSGNWTNVGSTLTATGATLSATDFVSNGPRRFYRMLVLP